METTKVKMPNGTELEISPLTSQNIHELDEWLKAMYLEEAAKVVKYLSPDQQNAFLQARMDKAMILTCLFGEGRQILFSNVYGLARFTYQAVRAPQMTFEQYHTLLFPDDLMNDAGLDFLVNLFKQIDGNETPSLMGLTSTFIYELGQILNESESFNAPGRVVDLTLEFYKNYTNGSETIAPKAA